MREVPRDNHWQEAETPLDYDLPLAQISNEPSETDLVVVALLMRLYDVNMALLSHFDKETADNIYDTHANGGTFNPPIFIPSPGDDDSSTGEEESGV